MIDHHLHLSTKPLLAVAFLLGKTVFKQLIEMFKKPAAKNVAQEDLEEAHRQYLKHTAAAAYHAKVSEFYSDSILRLAMYIKKA